MTPAREATTRLAELLRHEHHALAEFLVALSVFDRERRWIDLGYNALFPFLTRELGLSKGAAYYRMTAAALVQRYPEVLAALRDGNLCLTSIVELSKVLTPENRAEVLPRFFHLSKREAKEVTAELRPAPAPPLRTVVTAVPAAGVGGADRGDAALSEVSTTASAVPLAPSDHSPRLWSMGAEMADGRSSSEPRSMLPGPLVAPDAAPVVGQLGPAAFTSRAVQPANLVRANAPVPGVASVRAAGSAPGRRRPEVEPLTAELSRLHMTVTRRLLGKLAAARDALSHSHPDASDADILEVGLDLILDRHWKRRGIGAKPRRSAGSSTVAAPSALTATPAVAPDGPAYPEWRGAPRPQPVVPMVPAAPALHRPPLPPAAPIVPAPPAPRAAPPPPPDTPVVTAPPEAPGPPPVRRSRHVPAAVWRAVWERDQGRCVWPLEGGGVCGSTRRLELDHVDGFALGAPTTVHGCRLLCSVHNDLHARALYGDEVMNRCVRRRRGRCAEPVARWSFAATDAHVRARGSA